MFDDYSLTGDTRKILVSRPSTSRVSLGAHLDRTIGCKPINFSMLLQPKLFRLQLPGDPSYNVLNRNLAK